MTRYRVIHFVPDLVMGARVPVGAAVETAGGIQVVCTSNLNVSCLGHAAAVGQLVIDMLEDVRSLDVLPLALNGLAEFGPVASVPAEDGPAWVRAHLFPHREVGSRRGERRATQGYQYMYAALRPHGVHKAWIHRKFDPMKHGPEWLRRVATLPNASQWVGADQVLLLEPIVLDRPTLYEDLAAVTKTLSAYATAAHHFNAGEQLGCAAYVVGGDPQQAKPEVLAQLRVFTDDVFDLAKEPQQERLAASIRALTAGQPAAEAK